jgi:hypothetical protein
VKNLKSKLKLKNLKELSVVSEIVEFNIEANKFKEPDPPSQRLSAEKMR